MTPILATLATLRQPVNRSLVEAMARALRASAEAPSDEPLRTAFLARALSALARLTRELSPALVSEAVGATSDYDVLLTALEHPEAIRVLGEADPLAEARLRDLELRKRLLTAEGGTLTVEEVAGQFGVTRQAVDKRRRAGRILALPIGQHRYAYPAWQFDPSGMLPGFEEALAELSLPDPFTQAAFFLGENTYLNGERPLDVLRRGDLEEVRRAAWALGEQGAA